jgi:methylenetetrahydrofolate dehydrogenase (NADP+)/methenyltetrahydrofolate cyclohydrolase
MSAIIIDGKALAQQVIDGVAAGAKQLPRAPGLAVILVGEDPASGIYVRNKLRRAEEVGFVTRTRLLQDNVTEAQVLAEVQALNDDPSIDGILVQLPLPQQVNTLRVMAAIAPDKDVDGLHALNAGLLSQGSEGLVPCTPLGCLQLIKTVIPDLTGMNAVVLGSSNIVGKPMAALLLAERATVTMAHVHTRDTAFLCRGADILVSAVGKAGLVRGDWIKPRAVVIDVGINRIQRPDGSHGIVGDVAFDEAVGVAGAITPVPGGVGPMTIACLMQNTLRAAEMRQRQATAA